MKKLFATSILTTGLALAQGGSNNLQMVAPPPSGPQQVYVTNTGTTGNTTWCYWVIAVFNSGMSNPGGPACTATANATLTGGNYNTVSWNPPPGGTPIGYWVIAATSNVFPGAGTTSVTSSVISSTTFSQTQTSNTLQRFTYSPASWANYSFTINNVGFSLPVVQIQDQNGIVQYQWYMNGNIHHKVESVEGNITVAALHAAPTIVAPVLGASIRVLSAMFQAKGGSAATCTSVQVTDTAGSPNIAVQIPVADLTANTVTTEASANAVLTNWLTTLGSGLGLVISDSGGQCTTATSFNYRIYYKVLP